MRGRVLDRLFYQIRKVPTCQRVDVGLKSPTYGSCFVGRASSLTT